MMEEYSEYELQQLDRDQKKARSLRKKLRQIAKVRAWSLGPCTFPPPSPNTFLLSVCSAFTRHFCCTESSIYIICCVCWYACSAGVHSERRVWVNNLFSALSDTPHTLLVALQLEAASERRALTQDEEFKVERGHSFQVKVRDYIRRSMPFQSFAKESCLHQRLYTSFQPMRLVTTCSKPLCRQLGHVDSRSSHYCSAAANCRSRIFNPRQY